ncbi:peptide ABC transporter ATPase [Ruegeria sp. ANG-R]|uniref:type I secretion system permease/ATPase n=1 Tax=Ruegeria sp. ANG-R TaxID=1577903 RepID=UPI00057CA277|nr:type I secretion system permease/ATPase [Ruegeria sp. ANG-R]KIC36652.1 peptide ABC transporter ATPase [Ruegeria sp. ANG-R]
MSIGRLAGVDELRRARRTSRGLYWAAGLFSFFVNLLMLTGPLYMLQVYDRVLGSRSEATLVAMSLLVAFLFVMMGLLDYARGRILTRAGARFQAALDRRVFDAMIRRSATSNDASAQTGLSDLESVQKLISSPVLMAAFDLPWTPLFLAGIALFHPYLGILAFSGGLILVLVALCNQIFSRHPQYRATIASQHANVISNELRSEAGTIQAMGMRDAAFTRWQDTRSEALARSVSATDVVGGFTTATKTLRLFLQSAMLGLGAYLVLQGEVTPGVMIAASILLGRALAPVELALGQWGIVQRAIKGWRSLSELLARTPPEPQRMLLPKPSATLDVQSLSLVPPGGQTPILRSVSFRLQPGQALGVIGPSGSGKSSLARGLTAVWKPATGTVRLAGAGLEQYDAETLGKHIGYLPQRVQLFEGTLAQNIARLAKQPDPEKVVVAAKKAAAHDLIVALPDGYDTPVDGLDTRLSGGQMQRIALARALYDDPVIVILDEPNSNLDNEGSGALNRAVAQLKEEGKGVLIMAHRPAAIQECDLLLVLNRGICTNFGPKEKVLREMVDNHKAINKKISMGGVQ